MGGFSSGRRALTPDTDDCVRVSLCDLSRDDALKRYQMARRKMRYSRFGAIVADLTILTDIDCLEKKPCLRISGWAFGRKLDQSIDIIAQPQPFGGERFFALCPINGRRCTSLILPPDQSGFASISGWGVPYASQRERKADRAYRTIDKLEGRLMTMSKYARRASRDHLWDRWETAAQIVDAYERRLLGQLS